MEENNLQKMEGFFWRSEEFIIGFPLKSVMFCNSLLSEMVGFDTNPAPAPQ